MGLNSQRTQLTLLIADDEPRLRKMMRRTLEAVGYRVIEAQSARHAIRIAQTHDGPIDLLLTDVVMPEMNGQALARQAVSYRPSLRVLFISGHAQDIVTGQGAVAPNADFLAKPFNPNSLVSSVQHCLREVTPSPAVPIFT
jgi:DNA-binding NtrC family response regulator